MGNMSYCRFENTLGDLEDCYNNMDESTENISNSEERSRKKLIKLCCAIAIDYGYEVDRDIHEE